MKFIFRFSLLAIVLFYAQLASAQLSVSATSDTTSCYNVCDGISVATAANGTGPYFFQWKDSLGTDLPTETSDTLKNACVNKYIIRVIDSNIPADTVYDTISIYQPDSLVLIDTVYAISCGGTNDGAIKILGLGGTTPYQYSIDSGNSYQSDTIFYNLDTTTQYQVAIKDTNGCVSKGENIRFLIPEVPTVSATATVDTTSCFGVCDGEASVIASGATTPFSYQWYDPSLAPISGGTGTSITSLCAGNNYIQVTPSYPPEATSSTSTDTLFIEDFEGGAANWTFNSGGSGPNVWIVDNKYTTTTGFCGSLGLVNTPNQPAGIAGAPNSNYLYISSNTDITGFGLCTPEHAIYFANQASDNYAEYTANISTVGNTGVSLEFYWIGVGTADDYGQVEYSVDGGSTWIVLPTKYNLTGSSWQQETITDPAFDNQSQLRIRFHWINTLLSVGATDPPFGVDQIIFSAEVASATVSTRLCPVVDTAIIFEPADITATVASNDETCSGNDGTITVTASGGKTGLKYSIDNGSSFQISNSFSGLAPASYIVVVGDSTTCTKNVDTVIIGSTNAITFTIDSTNISCGATADGSITVTANGGSGPLELSISNESPGSYSTTFAYTGLGATTYKLWVRDSVEASAAGTGCRTQIGTIVLTVPTTPTSTVSSDSVSCNSNCDGTVSVSPVGGGVITGFTYQWYSGAGTGSPVASATSASLANQCAGTYSVDVTPVVSTGYRCPIRDTVVLYEPAALSALSATFTNRTSCVTENGKMVVSMTGGTAPYDYSLDNLNWTPIQTSKFEGLGNGTYTFYIRDDNNCPFVIPGTFDVFDPTDLDTTAPTLTHLNCFQIDSGSIVINATGTNQPLMYSIDGGANYQTSDSLFDLLSAGNYNLVVKDADTCTLVLGQFTLTEPGNISTPVASSTATTCSYSTDGTINITAVGGTGTLTYSIDSGATYQTANAFDSLAPDTYNIMVVDGNGCTMYGGTHVVTAPDTLRAIVDSSKNVKCYGYYEGIVYLSTNLAGSNEYYLSLIDTSMAFGDTNSLGKFTGLQAGDYLVSALNKTTGCISLTDSVTITQPDSVGFNIGNDTAMCLRFDTTLIIDFSSDTNFTSFIWNEGDTTNIDTFVIFDYGTFYAVAIDDSGCIYMDTITVSDTCLEQTPQIYVPKAFTPNGDGLNDGLEIFYQNIVDFDMRIYNQWGELMYESSNINEQWNGTYNGTPVSTDAYAWKIVYTGYRNGILESGIMHGNVTVLNK